MISLKKINYLLDKKEKKRVLLLVFFLFIGMIFEIVGLGSILPAMSLILNQDISETYPEIGGYLAQFENLSQSFILFFGLIILVLIFLCKSFFLVFLSWKQASFSTGFSASLSRKLFFAYLQQPYSYHLLRNSAHLLRNIQNESYLLMNVSVSVINLSIEVTALLGIAGTLIYLEPVGALLLGFFFLSSGFLFTVITRGKLKHWGNVRQYSDGEAAQQILQGLGGIKEVKLMGVESFFLSKFNKHNQIKSEVLTKQITLQHVPRIYLELLAVIALAGLIIYMKMSLISFGTMLPTLSVFVAAAFRMIPSVNKIMSSTQHIRFNSTVIDLFYDEFKSIEKLGTDKKDLSLLKTNEFKDCLSVKNISFQYEGSESMALSNISLDIKKGEMVGLIGQSGSGKSTLIDIITGILPPLSGYVLADGKNVHQNLRLWQNQIGYVPQSIYLTDESLRKNIAFGIPEDLIDDSVISRAIVATQLDELVKDLPQGVDTIVGERGVRLSGGQRQRIGIARALYRDPAILVLDEATSALDTETESDVMDSIKSFHGLKTIFIIAHRLSTVQNCDRIYVLRKGKLLKSGIASEVLDHINES